MRLGVPGSSLKLQFVEDFSKEGANDNGVLDLHHLYGGWWEIQASSLGYVVLLVLWTLPL